MDSTSLLLTLALLVLGLFAGAYRFMRFLGFLTGTESKAKMRSLYPESHLSFDERVAERLRELGRDHP
jgi:hypothetical protein